MRPAIPSPAPVLLRGGLVLTLDPAATVHQEADVLVESGRIAAVGRGLELAGPGRVIDVSGCAVLPGLIQGHVHLGQTLFRGLAENRRLLAWLRERIWPLEAAHDAESAYWSARLGGLEGLLGGTTTIQDIGLGPEAGSLLEGIVDTGLRAVAGKCLMDSGDGLPERLAERTGAVLEETERLGERFDGAGDGLVSYVLNPRFALSCSQELLRKVSEIGHRRGWPVHTHALEQRDETAAVRAATGRDEIELFRDLGLLDNDLRIAHGVWLRPRHWPELARRRFAVVHCPSANLKLGSGIARVAGLRRAGIPVGVGGDGAPCNNRLDAWTEIRLAAQLQALRSGPGALSGLEALRLATSEGARALGLDREIGSIEPGKAADRVVLDLGAPELTVAPEVDPHDRIVFGAGRSAVRHVLVDGRLLVEAGRATASDPEATVRAEAARAAARVARRAGLAA
ncbi:MAG TPA: amidohydrolase family protein [Thermoanaerobaculia bacterium]|nr:amidohydrolase family protein [Thermoanaerobaculia bacterium]